LTDEHQFDRVKAFPFGTEVTVPDIVSECAAA
jgi:hypothetical protein